jgi:hypothetical protein
MLNENHFLGTFRGHNTRTTIDVLNRISIFDNVKNLHKIAYQILFG